MAVVPHRVAGSVVIATEEVATVAMDVAMNHMAVVDATRAAAVTIDTLHHTRLVVIDTTIAHLGMIATLAVGEAAVVTTTLVALHQQHLAVATKEAELADTMIVVLTIGILAADC